MTPYQQHQAKWSNCTACDLCEQRTNVVLVRGVIPCDVLMIGEAPGVSEDVLGRPFVGPAGKLLDGIVQATIETTHFEIVPPRVAFTNLIACVPKDEMGSKTTEPPKYAVEACRERLEEIIHMCKPRLIVLVGKFAAEHIGRVPNDCEVVEIIHPAAILRADISQKEYQTQCAVVTLVDAFEEL